MSHFNQGNLDLIYEKFLEALQRLDEPNETIDKPILENAQQNNEMISLKVQNDILNCYTEQVLKQIFEDLGDDVFSLLVDDSSGITYEQQMDVVIRYVDKCGVVKERFIGLVHVTELSALSLKSAIDDLFARYKLSLTKVRGLGHGGPSIQDDEINGLKALILKENHSAYYVHCFSYELQLVVLTVAQKHTSVWRFFEMVGTLANVVCATCHPKDMIRESQREKLETAFGHLAIDSEIGLNQEISLARAGDSYYNALTHLVSSYSSVIEVLEYIEETGNTTASQGNAYDLHLYLKTFDFVFYSHLMMRILEITSILSQGLQKKDQDLLNTVLLVNSTKQQLKDFRLEGFDSFFEGVNSFCEEHDIETIKMNANYVNPIRPRRKTNITYYDYYEFDCFNTVLDMQIQEFENRFNEVTSELLTCMGSLSPCNNFRDFDIPKILRLAEMYPYDFDEDDKRKLELELPIYIDNLKADERFTNLNGISTLVRLLVETKKHLSFALVYRLLKLSLVLPVATASVERCFPSMKCMKSDLYKRLGDEYSSERCICYIENELLMNVCDEDVVNLVESMTSP